MRHRAAIGLTEETDAVAIVVSEETGTISVSYRGRLSEGLDADELRKFLSKVLTRQRRKRRWDRVKEQMGDAGKQEDVSGGIGDGGEISDSK